MLWELTAVCMLHGGSDVDYVSWAGGNLLGGAFPTASRHRENVPIYIIAITMMVGHYLAICDIDVTALYDDECANYMRRD